VPQYLDKECITVVEGGVAETTEILKEQFDHILYTGNGTVGKVRLNARMISQYRERLIKGQKIRL